MTPVRRGRKSRLERLHEDVKARGAFTLVELARRHRLRLARHPRFADLYTARVEVSSIDAKRLGAEGHLDFEGGATDTPVRVRATATQRGSRLELVLVLHGFAEPARELLKQLCAPSYDDALERIELTEPRVVLSTSDMTLRTERAEVPILAGISFIAAVGFPPSLEARLQPATVDRKLELHGLLPARKGTGLRLTTCPPMTFRAGSFALEEAHVEVATRQHAGVRETQVSLHGVCGEPGRRVKQSAPMPREHELVQLALSPGTRGPVLPSLQALAPLVEGAAHGWEALEARVRCPGDWRLVSLERDVSLETGKTTSVRCALKQKDCALTFDGPAHLRFPWLQLRQVIGFPDDPAQTSRRVEAEGRGRWSLGRRRLFERPFDTTVTLEPGFAVQALAERVTSSQVQRLVEVLGLRPAPSDQEARPRPPWTCTLTLEEGTPRLTAYDDEERSLVWAT